MKHWMEKPLSRGAYAFWGFVLVFLKYNLDRATALFFIGERWSIFAYWTPQGFVLEPRGGELLFYGVLLGLSLPFLALGLWLTLRRLRDAAWSGWLLLLFFLPGLNLVFFLVLCVVPSAGKNVEGEEKKRPVPGWMRWVPENRWGAAAVGVLLSALLVLPVVWFGTSFLENYGAGLFCGLPFLQGMLAALTGSVHRRSSFWRCIGLAQLSVLLGGGLLLASALEGVICLLMAAPLACILAFFGAVAAYWIQRWSWGPAYWGRLQCAGLLGLLLLMNLEEQLNPAVPICAVETSVLVKAPPEKVWPRVVAFSELAPPSEWIFKLGIAYPIKAKIDGKGEGAIRECIFSTGAFVEPITVWDEPKRLAFDVAAQPEPMIEMTPYRGLHTPHLDHYLVSHRGEFLLLPQPDGSTLLQGTTWYQNRMWPQSYWRLWSDYLLHTVHRRVLLHIKAEAEAPFSWADEIALPAKKGTLQE